MAIYGPQSNYGSDPGLPDASLTAHRRVEGEVYLSWEVGASAALDVQYDAYRLVRKLREYPRDENDGYLLDSGAVLVIGSSGNYVDDFEDEEGAVVYYALFCNRSLGGSGYYPVAAAYSSKTKLHYDDLSYAMLPLEFQKDQPMVDFSSPQVFQKCLLEPALGEVQSLVKTMGVNGDLRWADPKALNGLGMLYGWPLSPLMDLEDFRDQLESLVAKLRQKGQVEMSLDLLSEVAGLDAFAQKWIDCQDVSLEPEDKLFMWNYELDEFGEGDGVTKNFTFTPSEDVEPGTIRVYDDTESQVIVDDGEGNLYLESSPATGCGTCVYSGAGKTIAAQFPSAPAMNDTVWAYHMFRSTDWDVDDAEVTTRYGYLGDRIKRSQAGASGLSPAAVSVFLHLYTELGEELADSFAKDEYLKIYVDDVKRKMKRFWPLFGETTVYLTDRFVVTASADDYAAHLPLEEGCAEMRDRGR